MLTSKQKVPEKVAESFNSIETILISIKPKVNDSRRRTWSSICTELQQLASLAESITRQRPRSNKEWAHIADTLDREGVELWNASARIREANDDESLAVSAALRLAGFRLVEAGLQQKPDVETLIHVLQLASKAGASLSATGSHALAASVLSSAAKYEEALKKTDALENANSQARVHAIVVYHCSRMEAVRPPLCRVESISLRISVLERGK